MVKFDYQEDDKLFSIIYLFDPKIDSVFKTHWIDCDNDQNINYSDFGEIFCKWKGKTFRMISVTWVNTGSIIETRFLLATIKKGRMIFTGFGIDSETEHEADWVGLSYYIGSPKNEMQWKVEGQLLMLSRIKMGNILMKNSILKSLDIVH